MTELTPEFLAESVCVEHGADLRWALAELSRLKGENERLIREAEATERAHAEYRRRWRDDDLFKTIDQIRTHWAGLRPAWAEDLALLQSRILHTDSALADARRQIAERDEALKPFAEKAEFHGPGPSDSLLVTMPLRVFRAVAALLSKGSEEPAAPVVDDLTWLAGRTNLELDHGAEDEEADAYWRIHSVNGGVNDREWTLVAIGRTPAEAIRNARSAVGEKS